MKITGSVIPVCVIIPCYRCAATIRRAVDSVFAQNVIPAEVVLVEDCSGDDTLIALQELERLFLGRIKIVQMKVNGGAASARNAGWSTATQPYVAFLDSDDSWHPEKLNIQYEYMYKHPYVALSGHQCVCLRENEPLPVLPRLLHETKIFPDSLLFKNAFSTPTVMLRREIPFRFQEGMRYLEDLKLWQQIAFAGLLVVRLESPLAFVHKPFYGSSGLSAQLLEMEKGELKNFFLLYKAGNIGFVKYSFATLFSIIKFLKRVLASKLKKS